MMVPITGEEREGKELFGRTSVKDPKTAGTPTERKRRKQEQSGGPCTGSAIVASRQRGGGGKKKEKEGQSENYPTTGPPDILVNGERGEEKEEGKGRKPARVEASLVRNSAAEILRAKKQKKKEKGRGGEVKTTRHRFNKAIIRLPL